MSGPVKKRLRLSPFENAPDDVIKHIFILLTDDVKTKMRLELINKICHSLITQRACWIMDNTLTIRFGNDFKIIAFNDFGNLNIYINGSFFDHDKASKALDILLKRITVCFIHLDAFPHYGLSRSCPANAALYIRTIDSMCKVLLENKQSIHIQAVKITSEDVDGTTFLNTLQAMDLVQVRKLEFNVTNPPIVHEVLKPFVRKCPNLKEFKIHISHDKNPFEGIVVLENCPYLERLEIFCFFEINRDTENMLIKICNDHSFINSLHLRSAFHNHRELEFVQSLSDETRLRIESFTCKLFREVSYFAYNTVFLDLQQKHRELFVHMLRYFPNMKNLTFLCLPNSLSILPEAVDTFMQDLAGRSSYVFNIYLSCSTGSERIRPVVEKLKGRLGPAVTVEFDKDKKYIECSKGNIQVNIEYEKYF